MFISLFLLILNHMSYLHIITVLRSSAKICSCHPFLTTLFVSSTRNAWGLSSLSKKSLRSLLIINSQIQSLEDKASKFWKKVSENNIDIGGTDATLGKELEYERDNNAYMISSKILKENKSALTEDPECWKDPLTRFKNYRNTGDIAGEFSDDEYYYDLNIKDNDACEEVEESNVDKKEDVNPRYPKEINSKDNLSPFIESKDNDNKMEYKNNNKLLHLRMTSINKMKMNSRLLEACSKVSKPFSTHPSSILYFEIPSAYNNTFILGTDMDLHLLSKIFKSMFCSHSIFQLFSVIVVGKYLLKVFSYFQLKYIKTERICEAAYKLGNLNFNCRNDDLYCLCDDNVKNIEEVRFGGPDPRGNNMKKNSNRVAMKDLVNENNNVETDSKEEIPIVVKLSRVFDQTKMGLKDSTGVTYCEKSSSEKTLRKNIKMKAESERINVLEYFYNRLRNRSKYMPLVEEMKILQVHTQEAESQKKIAEERYETVNQQVQEYRKQMEILSRTNGLLRAQLLEEKHRFSLAVATELNRSNEELARVRESMVNVLEYERKLMRSHIMRTCAEVREIINCIQGSSGTQVIDEI